MSLSKLCLSASFVAALASSLAGCDEGANYDAAYLATETDDYLDAEGFGPWTCRGDACTELWGRSGVAHGDYSSWLTHALGLTRDQEAGSLYFVQVSRANDDSPTAGRPGQEGELNLGAIQNAIGQLYPATTRTGDGRPGGCRATFARKLVEKVPTGWFFAHKGEMLNRVAAADVDCPEEDAPTPPVPGVLAHQIASDSSAYEVTAQAFALYLDENEIAGAAVIESTSGRYAEKAAENAELCLEITPTSQPQPTNCRPCSGEECPAADGDLLSDVDSFTLSYPDGVTASDRFVEKRGTISHAGVSLRIADLENPIHDGRYYVHWQLRTHEFVWQRCRATVVVSDGELALEEWFDCERLQYPPLIPIRSNVPEKLSTARIRPTDVRYRRPSTDACTPGEVLGEADHGLHIEYKFGVLLRSTNVGESQKTCLHCHEDTEDAYASPFLCATPEGVTPFGDGLTRNTATNSRDSRGKPTDHGFVMPIMAYLQGKRSQTRGDDNFNRYLRKNRTMNRHLHRLNELYCADTHDAPEKRYSRFPTENAEEAEEFGVRHVIDGYFALIANSDEETWSAARAVAACASLPEEAPPTR